MSGVLYEDQCQTYGHLLFIDLDEGVHEIQRLQITTPQVIPHGVRCERLLRVLSWVSFDLPEHLKTTLSALLVAAGEGNTELQTVPIVGRDIRDGQPDTEAELQAALIAMIPTLGASHDEGGLLVRNLLAEFLRGFSLRTLIFLLDMVLPQLDAYHAIVRTVPSANRPVKLLPNSSSMLLRMHRNLKKSTSRARNVPVTSFPRKEKNSCSKQSNLFLQICLVFTWGWMKTFKWLEASRSSSMGTPQGSLNHV